MIDPEQTIEVDVPEVRPTTPPTPMATLADIHTAAMALDPASPSGERLVFALTAARAVFGLGWDAPDGLLRLAVEAVASRDAAQAAFCAGCTGCEDPICPACSRLPMAVAVLIMRLRSDAMTEADRAKGMALR